MILKGLKETYATIKKKERKTQLYFVMFEQ